MKRCGICGYLITTNRVVCSCEVEKLTQKNTELKSQLANMTESFNNMRLTANQYKSQLAEYNNSTRLSHEKHVKDAKIIDELEEQLALEMELAALQQGFHTGDNAVDTTIVSEESQPEYSVDDLELFSVLPKACVFEHEEEKSCNTCSKRAVIPALKDWDKFADWLITIHPSIFEEYKKQEGA